MTRRLATEVEAPTPSKMGLSRSQVQDWARNLGVTEDVLVAAIVVYSEASPAADRQDEAEMICHSLFNRQILGYARRYDNSIWAVANRGNQFTSKRGIRDYSLGRIPNGATLDANLALVVKVLWERAKGEVANSVTNFFHPPAQAQLHAKNPTQYKTPDDVQKSWETGGLIPIEGFNSDLVRFFRERRTVDPEKAASAALAALNLEPGGSIPSGGTKWV